MQNPSNRREFQPRQIQSRPNLQFPENAGACVGGNLETSLDYLRIAEVGLVSRIKKLYRRDTHNMTRDIYSSDEVRQRRAVQRRDNMNSINHLFVDVRDRAKWPSEALRETTQKLLVKVCEVCPLEHKQECLESGYDPEDGRADIGIRGGLDERQRNALKQQITSTRQAS